MARSDTRLDHDAETCGLCCNVAIGARVARDMLAAGEYADVMSKWANETKRRWQKTKFYRLWVRETRAGRDPRQAFVKRGWEP